MDSHLKVMSALEHCSSDLSKAAVTTGESFKIEYDAIWYAIKCLSMALDGTSASAVRAELSRIGYSI